MVIKNQCDGKIDLPKLVFWFHLPETIYREGGTEILVLINQFYHRIDFSPPC